MTRIHLTDRDIAQTRAFHIGVKHTGMALRCQIHGRYR
jgi:hypothetical protein